MSPGILQPVLPSSWQVQWLSEFSGVGKSNCDEDLQTLSSQPVQPTGFNGGIKSPKSLRVAIAMCTEASLAQAGQGLHFLPSGGD